MASNKSNSKEIKYLNKDFTSLKQSLIEYAKAYFPNNYNDFSAASPGTMFIDMAAYVGDIMSFYLDNQIQETFLQYAKQKENLMTMAYMLGYRPKVTSAASTMVDVFQTLPAKSAVASNGRLVSGSVHPDWRYAVILQEGTQIANAPGDSLYYIPETVDFSISSSANPTTIEVYQTDGTDTSKPTSFLLKKTVPAISGEVKTATILAPTTREKFFTTTLTDTDIIEIIDVQDSEGNRWYEVPYLAQSTIIQAKKNVAGADPNYAGSSIEVPYLMEVIDIPRRFATRFKSDNTLELQFGAGIPDKSLVEQSADEDYLPNAYKVGMGSIEGRSLLFNAYNPANYINTKAYGISPSDTTLTVRYLVGGGAKANVQSNQINRLVSYTSSFYGGITPSAEIESQTLRSLAVNNPSASSGGGDGDSFEEIRLNTLSQFPSQMRAVTEQDYLATIYSMPAKFGQVAKAYITKDSAVFKKQFEVKPELKDPSVLSAYILSYDVNSKVTTPPPALMHNLKTYISNYRMLTDSINLKSGYVINIGVDFDIVTRPNYTSREVLANCIQVMKDKFKITNWQINQPIILSDIYTALDQVLGVQTVKKVHFYNLSDADGNYSKYGYDIQGATVNGIIYPSLDPSIFEIKYPDTDIYGRVVPFS